ncbi:MAG: AAA family ATPase, partial [Spirochaetia bacterium]|nr:AAA family ATPase [Spirochaetia bacterium]
MLGFVVDLFENARRERQAQNTPLAARMRPRNLEEYIGQEHILGPGRLLRRAIQIDQITSLLFYGPPGTGKTTLARVIAGATKSHFISINAVLAGVKDIREAIEAAEKILGAQGIRTVLFVDEVHRFNKSQQDALLPHVESGLLTLIGATTENPYFEVNKALVSRSRIFELRSLTNDDLVRVARAAIADPERGYGKLNVAIDPDGLDHLVATSSGDARALLNALELAVETTAPDQNGVVRLDLRICEDSIQRKAVLYDKDGDAHYDVISAFIKSVRGSDPDAALYWMARMVYAGEDPRFIFRRMIILASEDVGLADPTALPAVMAAAEAYDYVGLPEGRFHLAQACLHLATAPKSNSTMAFFDALKSVENEKIGEVPLPLRDASRDGEDFGHGKNYLYPHAFREHWVAQDYLPAELRGRVFYQPGEIGFEKSLAGEVEQRREIRIARVLESQAHSGESAFLELTFGEDDAAFRRIREKMFESAGLLRDK